MMRLKNGIKIQPEKSLQSFQNSVYVNLES